MYIFGKGSFSYHKMKSIGSMGYTGYLKKSNIPDVIYEFKPGIDSYFKLVEFRTNSHGLRDKEYSLEKPTNSFRVAVIGGSYTVPAGVEIDQAFHSILENRLNQEYQDLSYEFINFGVSGYKINNKIATLKYKALEYMPDLILFILDGSQFTEVEESEKEFNPKPKRNQFFHSFTYELISKIKLFKNDRKHQEFLNDHLGKLDEFDLALWEISQISKNYIVPICVVVLDHDYSHYELSTKIKSLVENNNLYYSNTIPAFKDTNLGDLTIDKIDIHPNAKANQMFADAIYNDLKKQSLLKNQ
ncbi:MAG: SGNH/GDSL hydrolase family protein [Thermodesulfobacteriota bacterium]